MAWKIREELKHVADPYAQQKYFKGAKTNTTTSESTFDPAQAEYFQNLLGGAQNWLSGGGLQGTGGQQEGNIAGALGAMGNYYDNVLSGNVDRSALDQAKQANMDAAQLNFERNTMPALTDQAQQAGQVGSSRSGIAAGLAASDMQGQVARQNAAMEADFQQKAIANKNAAAGGMLNLAGGLQALQDSQAANSDQAKALESLMAFKDLISGNMGGTTTQTNTAMQSGGNNWLGAGATIIGGIGSMMSDERMKKKKKKTGKKVEMDNGAKVDEYTWEWNEKAEKAAGKKGKAQGVLAQDVKKVAPDAVSERPDGILEVDYGKIKGGKKLAKKAK